jgi:hypothetical protein
LQNKFQILISNLKNPSIQNFIKNELFATRITSEKPS